MIEARARQTVSERCGSGWVVEGSKGDCAGGVESGEPDVRDRSQILMVPSVESVTVSFVNGCTTRSRIRPPPCSKVDVVGSTICTALPTPRR